MTNPTQRPLSPAEPFSPHTPYVHAMSEAAETEDPSLVRRAYRTVTPGYRGREDVEMDLVGWGILLGLVVLLVPLLPFLVIVWLVGRVLDAVAPSGE